MTSPGCYKLMCFFKVAPKIVRIIITVVVRDSKKIRLERQSGLATDSAPIARDAGKRGSFLLQSTAL